MSPQDAPHAAHATAIAMFLGFVAITLIVTWRAARRSASRSDFYAAGGAITPLQNGLAMAGDYMSAAAFLGVSGLITTSGFDGLLYGIGFTAGWPIVLFLIAGPLRRLGRFTFADALAASLHEPSVRIFCAVSTLCVVAFYLVAQMVGAGQLIELLFGLDYTLALILVGVLMVLYVMIGGMVATTWVQIIKAGLLLVGTAIVAVLTLARFGFNLSDLVGKAVAVHPKHAAILTPTAIVSHPISGLSLGLALLFGTSGLPHILMRFFTVADARAARRSACYATAFVGCFFLMVFVIGFGAVALIGSDPLYHEASGAMRGGANMAAVHLAHAVGGDALMGFISAVAFATILAVVSGLTLSAASAISHDLYARALGRRDEAREIFVSRVATLAVGLAAVLLGLMFRHQNVAYMVGLGFSIAASANFPILLLVTRWKRLTTAGALAGGLVGLVSAVALTVLGPAIWVKTLGYPTPIFPFDPPTIVSMPLAFLTAWLVSLPRFARAGTKGLERSGASGLT